MFTGLITGIGTVRRLTGIGDGHDMRIEIACPAAFMAQAIPIGASIACSGCCLTAIGVRSDAFDVEASAETLSKTNLGRWQEGTEINLERSLKLGDELGGHLVSGHVDGLGTIGHVTAENGSWRVGVRVPAPLHRFIAQKGSIAIDGISLTVNEVRGNDFGVNIIPHTWSATTLHARAPGDRVHIEIDMLARYVARLTETQQ